MAIGKALSFRFHVVILTRSHLLKREKSTAGVMENLVL